MGHAGKPTICANSVSGQLESQPILQELHMISFRNLPDTLALGSLYLEVLWS